MKKIILLIFFLSTALFAQNRVRGTILDEESKPLYSVNVYIPEIQSGTQTNFNGEFLYNKLPSKLKEITLKVTYVGFKEKTIKVNLPQKNALKIIMEVDPIETDEIVVTENREAVYLRNSPVKVEVITLQQIEKNFSIDLTQACQYTPGIKVQNNCGVCGTSDIRIQGLEGQYSQILIDGFPIISNLGTVYGLMGVSTSNIKQIEIVKGPGTILYGPEAVSGTMNIIMKDPSSMSPLSLTLSGTSHLEHSVALSGVKRWDNVASSLTLDYAGNFNKIDENNDNFTDVPLFERYSILNQWMADLNSTTSLKVFGRYYYENRSGGELKWNESYRGGEIYYGESIYTKRGELFGGLQNSLSNTTDLKFNFSGIYHDQNSYYGSTLYDANQFTSYIDALAISQLNDNNSLTLGTAFKYDVYDDNSSVTKEPVDSRIFSLFAQNEMKLSNIITTNLGLRYNYHNVQKSIWQPRVSVKISPSLLTNIRLSFGTGFRTVNLFTEDHAAYTGTRKVEILESLNPEKSINFSGSFVHKISGDKYFTTLQLSGHYTRFSNQIIPDYNSDVTKVIYKNLNGYSISQGMEASIDYENLVFPVKLSLAYTFLDTYKMENDVKSEIEFNPRHTLNVNIDYDFKDLGLTANLTGKWVGEQTLPLFTEPILRPTTSRSYSIWNINFKKEFDNIFLTIGMGNIFNYMQDSPLIDPKHPFGEYFDTTYIYAPLHGREVTLSIQYNL